MIWPACSICGSSDFEPWAASVLPPVLRKTIPLEWAVAKKTTPTMMRINPSSRDAGESDRPATQETEQTGDQQDGPPHDAT